MQEEELTESLPLGQLTVTEVPLPSRDGTAAGGTRHTRGLQLRPAGAGAGGTPRSGSAAAPWGDMLLAAEDAAQHAAWLSELGQAWRLQLEVPTAQRVRLSARVSLDEPMLLALVGSILDSCACSPARLLPEPQSGLAGHAPAAERQGRRAAAKPSRRAPTAPASGVSALAWYLGVCGRWVCHYALAAPRHAKLCRGQLLVQPQQGGPPLGPAQSQHAVHSAKRSARRLSRTPSPSPPSLAGPPLEVVQRLCGPGLVQGRRLMEQLRQSRWQLEAGELWGRE